MSDGKNYISLLVNTWCLHIESTTAARLSSLGTLLSSLGTPWNDRWTTLYETTGRTVPQVIALSDYLRYQLLTINYRAKMARKLPVPSLEEENPACRVLCRSLWIFDSSGVVFDWTVHCTQLWSCLFLSPSCTPDIRDEKNFVVFRTLCETNVVPRRASTGRS